MFLSLWNVLFIGAASASQTVLVSDLMQGWKLEVCWAWDVLGPFPISAREQHFLSPSFPLDLSSPYEHEPNRTWHSSLADGGKVGWKSFDSTETGRLSVSYPHIRWSSLRASEGWAAFQHHNVLRTTLTIIPPAGPLQPKFPWLAFSLQHVSFFALIPVKSTTTDTSITPEWYPGNIYGLTRSPKQLVQPPALSLERPTTYHLFMSGDYEIRLFGDPEAAGHQEPVLDVSLSITLEPRETTVALDPALHVTCDFVQGWAFGSALGIGIRAVDGQWEVLDVAPALNLTSTFSLSLLGRQRLAPSQSRILPIMIKQHNLFQGDILQVSITLLNSHYSSKVILTPTLNIRHWSSWDDVKEYTAVMGTYFLSGAPTPYLAIPPLLPNVAPSNPPIIALHGAGVDISDSFWPASLSRQSHSWLICPEGRTSWGFDWHGPSADDAWGSLAALTHLLSTREQWAEWTIRNDSRVVVIGHSNGGQGTWYLTARYPDRVLAAIPAAAYIKSQQYIPTSLSRGAHFMDPSHGGILAASLAPDDNDLFLTNVVDTKILAIHGGEDENVPTWHSRELVGLVKTFRIDANISFAEGPGKPHWYSDVLSSPRVQAFLSSVLEVEDSPLRSTKDFTLTVATPNAVGSFHGFSIRELEIPGRLAKLQLSQIDSSPIIKTSNVHTFSINSSFRHPNLLVDGTKIDLQPTWGSELWVQRAGNSWRALPNPPSIRPTGPMSRILSSPSRLLVTIPSGDQHAHSIALRLAHSMILYFRLDVEIVTDMEAMSKADIDLSDIVIIGSNNRIGQQVLRSGPGIVRVSPDEFTVNSETFTGPSLALIFLHPHPSSPDRVVLFLCGNDDSGLERAARLLLPIRTGVPLPEFLVIGRDADVLGVGGLRGGGFWSRTWAWNEAMAWLD